MVVRIAVAAAAGRLPLLAVGRVQSGRDLLSGAVIPRPSNAEQGFRNLPSSASIGLFPGFLTERNSVPPPSALVFAHNLNLGLNRETFWLYLREGKETEKDRN